MFCVFFETFPEAIKCLSVSVQDWQPPFACEVQSFRFTPRIQRLNELEVSFSTVDIILCLH